MMKFTYISSGLFIDAWSTTSVEVVFHRRRRHHPCSLWSFWLSLLVFVFFPLSVFIGRKEPLPIFLKEDGMGMGRMQMEVMYNFFTSVFGKWILHVSTILQAYDWMQHCWMVHLIHHIRDAWLGCEIYLFSVFLIQHCSLGNTRKFVGWSLAGTLCVQIDVMRFGYMLQGCLDSAIFPKW